jgi:hypothetical protein
MWKQLESKLFGLLADTSQITNKEMQNAYDDFVTQVLALSQSEFDYIKIFRTLNIARIELVFMESVHRYEQGKNALKFAYHQKAILLLESEINLLKLISPQANPFSNNLQSNSPKVYFIPNPQKGLGIDSMGELAVSFELSEQFLSDEGNPAPYIHITHALEQAFNFTFGSAYKSKERVFKRKPFNRTRALDFLRNLTIRKDKQDEK